MRDAGGLESALAYPQNLAAYGEPGLAELAAGYLFAIAENHAFVDGNKRTAWTVMRLFVALNGGRLDYDKLDAVRFVEGVAGGEIDYDGAREWIASPTLSLKFFATKMKASKQSNSKLVLIRTRTWN